MDTLGEFVKLLLIALQEKNVAFQLKDRRSWHKLVYRLKQLPASGKPIFFDELWFDWNGPYPRSRELDELLTTLRTTGAVKTTSPQYGEWRLSDKMFILWCQTYMMLATHELQFLDLAAALAEDEFKKSAPRVA